MMQLGLHGELRVEEKMQHLAAVAGGLNLWAGNNVKYKCKKEQKNSNEVIVRQYNEYYSFF